MIRKSPLFKSICGALRCIYRTFSIRTPMISPPKWVGVHWDMSQWTPTILSQWAPTAFVPNKRWYLNHIARYALKCHTILQHRYEQNTMIKQWFRIYVIKRVPRFTVWRLKFTQIWRKYGFSYIFNTVALPRNVWLMNVWEPPRLHRMVSPGFLCS